MRTVALRDVATTGSGGTPKRSEPDYFGDGTPWLSIADLNDGVVTTAKESLTEAGIANSSAKILPAGTLLIAMYGSIGKLGIAGRELCTSQAIAFVRPDPNHVDLRYLFHYFLAERPRLLALGRGGTQMNIGQGDLKEWLIPLPPLDEQRRIAAILDQADALRTKRRQVAVKLDALAKSIFLEMFGDSTKSRAWPSRSIADIAAGTRNAIVDGPFGSALKSVDYLPSGIPVIRIKNISRDGELIKKDLLFISREKFDVLRRSSLRPGDVLVSRVGTLGNTCIFPADIGDALLSTTGVCKITPDTDLVTSTYLHQAIRTAAFQAQIERSASTSVQKYFNLTALRSWQLVVPSMELQFQFGSRIDAVYTARTAVLKTLAADNSLFASLQSRAFQGEL